MDGTVSTRPGPTAAGASPAGEAVSPPRAKKPPFKFVIFLKQLLERLRQGRAYVPHNAVAYDAAVRQFLGNVMGVCARTFPAWQRLVESGLAEQSLSPDHGRDLAAQYPLDDLFFAGFVALEASRLPALYGPEEGDTIICAIAEEIDRYAQRRDRLLSDLLFEVLARLHLMNPAAEQRPYDKIVKVILRRLDFDQTDAGRMLLADKAFRHSLAEPFARHSPQWWEKFKTHFVLYDPAPSPDATDDQNAMAELIAKTEAGRKQPKAPAAFGRTWRKRAPALFDHA